MESKRQKIEERYKHIMSSSGGYDGVLEVNRYSHVKAAYIGHLLRKHGVLPGRTILEVGVGTALIASPLAQSGWDVVGIDFSEDMLRGAKERLKEHSIRNVYIARADGFTLPFANNQFDAVIAIQVLHLFEPKERQLLLQEFYRVIKPGGVVIVDMLQRFSHLKKWWRNRNRRPHRYEPPSGIRATFSSYPQTILEGGILPLSWKIHRLNQQALFKPLIPFCRAPILKWFAHSHFAVIPKNNSR